MGIHLESSHKAIGPGEHSAAWRQANIVGYPSRPDAGVKQDWPRPRMDCVLSMAELVTFMMPFGSQMLDSGIQDLCIQLVGFGFT